METLDVGFSGNDLGGVGSHEWNSSEIRGVHGVIELGVREGWLVTLPPMVVGTMNAARSNHEETSFQRVIHHGSLSFILSEAPSSQEADESFDRMLKVNISGYRGGQNRLDGLVGFGITRSPSQQESGGGAELMFTPYSGDAETGGKAELVCPIPTVGEKQSLHLPLVEWPINELHGPVIAEAIYDSILGLRQNPDGLMSWIRFTWQQGHQRTLTPQIQMTAQFALQELRDTNPEMFMALAGHPRKTVADQFFQTFDTIRLRGETI